MSQEYGFHPLAQIFPSLKGEEFERLKADIAENGLREPIVLYEGMILDGRNRYRACRELGIKPHGEDYTDNDPVGYVVSLNLHRRHLNDNQRAIVAAELANVSHGGDRRSDQTANRRNEITTAQAAELVSAKQRTVERAKSVHDKGAPALLDAMKSGRVSILAAADVATLPEHEQQEIIAAGDKVVSQKAKEVRKRKSAQQKHQNDNTAQRPVVLPTGKFGTIVIDPPWPVQKIQRDLAPDQVAFDYPVMSPDEILAFGETVNGMASDDCHLFMWTTQKYLPLALQCADDWQFKYVLTMVWHKPGGFQPFNLPQYNCEFVIYARKGSPSFTDTKAFNCCFNAPRREHSRKPDEFYDLIKRVTPDGRIDVFSREHRDGFDQFGNEADKFNAESA